MRHVLRWMIVVLIWLAASKAWSQLTVPPTRYRVVALGTLGGKSTTAFALNNRGQVVGQSEDSKGRKHAFLWEKGKMRSLNLPPARFSTASDINDRGQVVCVVVTPDEKTVHILLWQDGKTRTIFTERKPKGGYSWALINNRGLIAGMTNFADDTQRLFTWQDGKLSPIQVAPSYNWIIPGRMNDTGQITAHANHVNTTGSAACIIENGRLRPLAGVGGHISIADGINNRGQIVGYVGDPYVTPSRNEPFLWEQGKLTVLKTSTYRDIWMPNSINNKGQILGAGSSNSKSGLLLWQDGKLYQLNDLLPLKNGWAIDGDQMSINDRGEMLVHLERKSQTRAYLLVPIK